MASRQAVKEVAERLGALYPHIKFIGTLAEDWELALNSLTDVQVSESLQYLRTKYGTGPHENASFPPQPSQFVNWSRSGGTRLTGVSSEYFRYLSAEDHQTQQVIEFVPSPPPRPAVRYVSLAERSRRKLQLARITAGALDMVLDRHERMGLVASNDPVDLDVLGTRNRLRAALGWPQLNTEGHEEAR
jgi:hypothetical protein